MAKRKLRLEIQQSEEYGECLTPRWYGQHAITTHDITGSIVKILITDSRGKLFTINVGKNGNISEINGNTEFVGEFGIWIDRSDLQNDIHTNTHENILPHSPENNQRGMTTSSENTLTKLINETCTMNSQSVKQEIKEYDESTAPPSTISFKEIIGVTSEGYHSEILEPKVEEEFHTEMERIKSEERNLAGKFETVYVNSITSPEINEISKPEKNSEFSDIILESNNPVLMPLLCRLCASQHKDMVYIFEPNKPYKNIWEKIEDCLPILVRETDTLPKQVCRLCLEKLEMCYKFHKTVAETEKKFLVLGGSISEELKHMKKHCQAFPVDSGTLEDEKLTEKSVSISKSSNFESNSLPLSTDPKFTYSTEKIAEKDNADDDIIFVGQAVQAKPIAGENEEYDIIKCRLCGKFFGTARNCYLHSDIHKSENYYPCSMCNEVLTSKKDGYKHSLEHTSREARQRRLAKKILSNNICHGKEAEKVRNEASIAQIDHHDIIKCRICGIYFGSGKSCYMHSRIHATENQLPCSMCDKTFTNEQDSYIHSQEHIVHKSIQRRATMNKKQLSSNENLRSLLIMRSTRALNSTEEKVGRDETDDNIPCEEAVKNQITVDENDDNSMIKCRICGLPFKDVESCYTHSIDHIGKKHYPCTICNEAFTTEGDSYIHSLEHMLSKANEKRPFIHICGVCGKRFITEDRLQFHEIYHNPKMKPCYCKKCDKFMASETSLYNHMVNIHSQFKEYNCNICRKQFRGELQLNAHRSKHATRSLGCSSCEKRFFSKNELKLHRLNICRSMSNTKNYSCHYCGRAFLHKWSLVKHIRRHTDKCLYRCEFCPKTYHSNQSKNKHQLCHSGKGRHKCSTCEKRCFTLGLLKKHESTHSETRNTTVKV